MHIIFFFFSLFFLYFCCDTLLNHFINSFNFLVEFSECFGEQFIHKNAALV